MDIKLIQGDCLEKMKEYINIIEKAKSDIKN